ncbi:MAG: LLM class flavin-dependent oxidoreductase [Candidatus Thiodiazotropha sp. (ex Codakia rugifera)]|nr:LLM class flavin-dependent oxidoreductase [Candidatus Thiodiazotropha sp. (ex Codakia rugifera)]
MSVSFEIGILPNRPVSECLSLTRQAEECGYGGVWVADSQCVMRDAYILLSQIALQTSRIQVAAGVTNAITRHPAVLANSWATLGEVSHGRAVLGIGVGESAVHTLGLKPDRLAALEKKIILLRALMKGQEVEYEGRSFRLTWCDSEVPIVMACSGPKSLQLGGRVADGVLFQVGADPAFVRYALDNIRQGAEEAGRRLEDIRLYMRVATAVSAQRDRARDQIKGYASVAAGTVFKTVPRDYFTDDLWQQLDTFKAKYDYFEHGSNRAKHQALLTDTILDAVCIAGTPEEAIPRFKILAEMGIDAFVWPANMMDAEHFIHTFADRVMPEFTVEEQVKTGG